MPTPQPSSDFHAERDYKLIEGGSPGDLERKVHHMMRTHGWQPLGGVAVVNGPTGAPYFWQAMARADVMARADS